MRKFLYLCLIALALFGGARLYYALTDDFRLSNIQSDATQTIPVTTEPLQGEAATELNTLLQQPYTYLGKGAQSYVFESADGKYVLKFFKFKHVRPSLWLDMLPPIGFLKTYKEKQQQRKLRKFEGVFNGYKIAYEKDRDLSGLIFVKLSKTDNLYPTIQVTDKLGLKHTINLNDVPFILQRKGITLRDQLKITLNKGHVQKAIQEILSIFALYQEEYARGVWDHDHGVLQNSGFIDGNPAHLDVGKLQESTEMQQKEVALQDLSLLRDKINIWLNKYFPEYQAEINSAMEKYLGR